jgi:phosphatidylethanolamine/phosphatidyl-N-methylethanolamine N-methyltransferase
MAVKYDLEGQQRAYAKWASFYDKVYVGLLADAQRRLAAAASAAGPSILEVGAGTGLVLRYYGASTRVVAVDLSEAMLSKAAEKVVGAPLPHVAGVACMDACRLGFADGAFDAVTFPFVITLVPDPEGALDEAARVLRPGGEIVVASKLGDDTGLVPRIEDMVAPLARKVGWSSDFKLSRLSRWAARRGDFTVIEVRPVFPAGFFRLVRMRKAR